MLVPVLLVERDERKAEARSGWAKIEETGMTTRLDHEFFNSANTPSCIQPGEGLESRAVGWEQQPASAPSSHSLPCLPSLAFSQLLCFTPQVTGRGTCPMAKAGRLAEQKELTQHWERPSCNKAPKAHAQQQSTKAPSPPARPSALG